MMNDHELGEGLRDVAVVVGADCLLPFVVEGLTANMATGAAAAAVDGWVYALFAMAGRRRAEL